MNADAHTRRCVLLHVTVDALDDLLWFLIGYQTAGDLGMGRGGDDRLDAFALEAAPDTVDFKRGPRPVSLDRGIAGLAKKFVNAELGFILHLVKGNGGEPRTIRAREGDHRVIEALHQDCAFGTAHGVEQAYERMDRVLYDATVKAGVKVMLRAVYVDLETREAS